MKRWHFEFHPGILHLLFVTSLPAPFCVNPSCTWELPCPGGKDIFAHTQQFTGDGDSLRGGERVIFAAWLGDLGIQGWEKLGIPGPFLGYNDAT